DDDDDGVEDRFSPVPWSVRDLYYVEAAGRPLQPKSWSASVLRVVGAHDAPSPGARAPRSYSRLGLQGLSPGRTTLDLGSRQIEVVVCEVSAVETGGAVVNLATSHASLSRTLPASLATDADGSVDRDALSWRVTCPAGFLPGSVSVTSLDPRGTR